MSDAKRYTVRIQPELLDQIKHRADAREVSLNEWIVKALASTLQRTTGEEIVIREVIL